MSTSKKPTKTLDNVTKRVCLVTLKTINKNAAHADRGERVLNLEEEKIEKCRRLFIRRHTTLMRTVEKDLQDLRTEQKRIEQERQRRLSYCLRIKAEKTEKIGKMKTKDGYDFLLDDLTREEQLMFGISNGNNCNAKRLPQIKINNCSTGGRNYRQSLCYAKCDTQIKNAHRKTASLPNIRI